MTQVPLVTTLLPIVLAALLTAALVTIGWLIHFDRAMRQAVRDVIDGVETAEHRHDGEPCRSPGCARARIKIRAILHRHRFGRNPTDA